MTPPLRIHLGSQLLPTLTHPVQIPLFVLQRRQLILQIRTRVLLFLLEQNRTDQRHQLLSFSDQFKLLLTLRNPPSSYR